MKMKGRKDITADAVALQERDEFLSAGWLKVIAPAKVNLHLAIGERRADGYHDAVSIMHALALHDVVYMRRKTEQPDSAGSNAPIGKCSVRMVPLGDVEVPDIEPRKNLALKAVHALAEQAGLAIGSPEAPALEMRIEKAIPAQGGLGGGSTDAAAALVGAAKLWRLENCPDKLEEAARNLGSDVAFFLHGACSAYVGRGDEFARSLKPSKQAIALVKVADGISTADAYSTFDALPEAARTVQSALAENALQATNAEDVKLFNNLANAAEQLSHELSEVRTWLVRQPGVGEALLCGSGSTTFATCDTFSDAARVVAAARERGWWARATSLCSARAMVITSEAGS